MSERHDNTRRVIEVGERDLPLHCPMPGDTAWCSHPRVFLAVEEKGESLCPYCGTRYNLKGCTGRPRHGH